MAPKQRETRHELEDGFVVAWDSSEPDKELREQLIELADQQIGGIVIGMGGKEAARQRVVPSPAKRRKSSRHRRAA